MFSCGAVHCTWALAGVAFGAASSDSIQVGGGIGNIHRNAPSVVITMLGAFSILGLFLIWLGTLAVRAGLDIDLSLTMGNIVLGLTVSFIIGLISGSIPAFIAARMDPVEAIRAGG